MSVALAVESGWVPTIDHERQGFVRCRNLRHAWDYYDSNWTTSMGTPVTLRCQHCGTERREVVGAYGQLVSRHYKYPDHYRYPKGMRPDSNQFRLMFLMQAMQEARSKRT